MDLDHSDIFQNIQFIFKGKISRFPASQKCIHLKLTVKNFHLIFLGSIWSTIKHTVTGSHTDDKEKEHKEQFTALVRELGAALRGNNHILTLTVMPHVNDKGKIPL